MTHDEIIEGLRKIDTPTITNVVATYPKNPLCLGLYNPWAENWYTDTSIRCIYPEMGAIVGYAVTCVFGLPDPNFSGRLSFMDVVDALDARHARYTAASGTATKIISTGFGELAAQGDGSQIELRASWSPLESDVSAHVEGWGELLCMLAGLPPTGEGVSLLSSRASASRKAPRG